MDKNSIALVTGANSGIGKAAAAALAKQGLNVVMLCRDKERGEEALRNIKETSGSGSIELMLCDLSCIESINAFCDEFLKKYGRLNILINNAGVLKQARRETGDGCELCFRVNYLGAFLLTMRLLPLLKASTPARIVNVSSIAHRWGKIHFDDINITKRYTAMKSYSQSKLAGLMFTYALAEKLNGTGVTVNAADPGIVGTSITVNRETGFGSLASKAQKLLFKTPEKGAETAVYLATSPEVEGVTGKFFARCKAMPSAKHSYNKSCWERLWRLSERMTGLAESQNEETANEEYCVEVQAEERTAFMS